MAVSPLSAGPRVTPQLIEENTVAAIQKADETIEPAVSEILDGSAGVQDVPKLQSPVYGRSLSTTAGSEMLASDGRLRRDMLRNLSNA